VIRHFGIVACLFSAALCSLINAAVEKPDFSGTWELNTARSEFNGVPPPKGLNYRIVHNDPLLRVKSTMSTPQGEVTMDMTYSTDGKETINKTPAGDIKAVARWQGAELVISGQAAAMRQDERWSLSKDQKTLTIKLTPENETQLTFVMEKR
jgi:hypothetical protein